MPAKTFVKAGACLAISLLSVGGAALAMRATDLHLENSLTLGVVDIAISESTCDTELIFDDGSVRRETTVVNNGEPCWIRASTSIDMKGTDGVPSENALAAADETGEWLQAQDGRFYCKHALDTGQSASFCDFVSNPLYESWNGNGFSFAATITFEAIQCAAFTPDFSSGRPWGDANPIAYASTPYEGDSL